MYSNGNQQQPPPLPPPNQIWPIINNFPLILPNAMFSVNTPIFAQLPQQQYNIQPPVQTFNYQQPTNFINNNNRTFNNNRQHPYVSNTSNRSNKSNRNCNQNNNQIPQKVFRFEKVNKNNQTTFLNNDNCNILSKYLFSMRHVIIENNFYFKFFSFRDLNLNNGKKI